MLISLITKEDIPEILILAENLAKEDDCPYDPEYKEWLEEAIIEGDILCAKAMKGEEVIGFATSMISRLPYGKHRIFGLGLQWYVKQEHRRGKAAWMLFRIAESWAKTKGATIFCVQINESRKALYENKRGYQLKHLIYAKEVI